MIKKVIYNAGAQIIAKIVTATATLLITLIIGRALGPAGYGEFTKIFVFIGYFYTITDFGLNAIFIKDTNEKNLNTLFKALLGVRLLLSVVFAFFAVVISGLLPYDPSLNLGFSPTAKLGILIASTTIITQALYTSANAVFQKRLRYDLSAISAITSALVVFLISLINMLTINNLYVYVSAYFFGGLTTVLFSKVLLNKYLNTTSTPTLSLESFKNTIRKSTPIGIALVLNLVYFRLDIFILSFSRPTTDIGIYGLAYQFFEASLAVPIFFANALYPLLSAIYAKNRQEYVRQIRFWIIFLSALAVFLTLALIFISFFIPIIFGTKFAPSQAPLMILSLGLPLFFISALFWHMLIIKSKQTLLAYIYAAGAIANLTLNLIFIPQYGYIAASIITVASELLIVLLLVASIRFTKAID